MKISEYIIRPGTQRDFFFNGQIFYLEANLQGIEAQGAGFAGGEAGELVRVRIDDSQAQISIGAQELLGDVAVTGDSVRLRFRFVGAFSKLSIAYGAPVAAANLRLLTAQEMFQIDSSVELLTFGTITRLAGLNTTLSNIGSDVFAMKTRLDTISGQLPAALNAGCLKVKECT